MRNIDRSIECECSGASGCPDQSDNGTCVTQPGGYCYVIVEEVINDNGALEVERISGCLPPEEAGFMQCKGSQVPHLHPKVIECCSDSDFCNRRLNPEPAGGSADVNPGLSPVMPAALLCAALLLALAAAAGVLILLRRRKTKRPPSPLPSDLSTGSGSGLPLLVQRTVANQIQMLESVGKGRFGEVWLARWRDEKVAVKVFFTTEEASWFRETEIYQTVLMRHENVLGFIAADIKGTGSWTQMLLITEYHRHGSLYDYLQNHTLEPRELAAIAHSIASGLSHLHMDISGARGKPGIAHRDLKTKNILVKRDGKCAIADFGLAVRYVAEQNEVDIAINTRTGTLRYLPPEVLSGIQDGGDFEAHKMADVYSLGLVLWEACRRTGWKSDGGVSDPYCLPYSEWVNSDPGWEEMRDVVCVRGLRPFLAPRWSLCEPSATVATMLPQCWSSGPRARLTALRVKKNLDTVIREHFSKPNV